MMRRYLTRGVMTNLMAGVLLTSVLFGCGDVTAKLPAGAVDPEFYKTPEAADRIARNARYEFQGNLMQYLRMSGMFSDELRWKSLGNLTAPLATDWYGVLDSRDVPEEPRVTRLRDNANFNVAQYNPYNGLQRVRGLTRQARYALAAYAPDAPPAMRSEMLVYEGLAEVMLADLFCSGIPLSVVEFEGDIMYRPSSRTADVYTHAIALFDSAITLSISNAQADAQVEYFARVSKGRALLALGRYADADTTVATVPAAFRFLLAVQGVSTPTSTAPTGYNWENNWGRSNENGHVADREGINGLPFLSVPDPRVVVTQHSNVNQRVNSAGIPIWFPVERQSFVLAGHVEARLIQAEAALNAGRPEWLTILNTLRTTSPTCTVNTTPCTAPAGTGGVAGLPLLTDPALDPLPPGKTVADVRVDLIFNERAKWLFVTGVRQGDLRRLIRNYGREINTTYPSGPYRGSVGAYGQYIDVPIPDNEKYNPYFHGCLARGE